MKRRFVIISLISFLFILFAAWQVYNRGYIFKGSGVVKIKCKYMMYACGDCYPQWQIDSFSANKNGLQKLIRKDFYVFYKGKKMEESFPDSTDKCVICYDFYFDGRFRKTLSNKYRFEADSFEIKLERPDCCN